MKTETKKLKLNKEPIKVLYYSGEVFTCLLVMEIERICDEKAHSLWREREMCLHSAVTLQHPKQSKEEKLTSINQSTTEYLLPQRTRFISSLLAIVVYLLDSAAKDCMSMEREWKKNWKGCFFFFFFESQPDRHLLQFLLEEVNWIGHKSTFDKVQGYKDFFLKKMKWKIGKYEKNVTCKIG